MPKSHLDSNSEARTLFPEESDTFTVFISHSRVDQNFCYKLASLLTKKRIEVLTDQNLKPCAEYFPQLEALIAKSSALIFIISPDSAGSSNALAEVAIAERMGKKILPVLFRSYEGPLPEVLSKTQWIYCSKRSDAKKAVASLIIGVKSDPQLTATHTWLLLWAEDWKRNQRPALNGRQLKEAEEWLPRVLANVRTLPNVTPLQQQLITASQHSRTRRYRLMFISGIVIGAALGAALAVAVRQTGKAQAAKEEAQESLVKTYLRSIGTAGPGRDERSALMELEALRGENRQVRFLLLSNWFNTADGIQKMTTNQLRGWWAASADLTLDRGQAFSWASKVINHYADVNDTHPDHLRSSHLALVALKDSIDANNLVFLARRLADGLEKSAGNLDRILWLARSFKELSWALPPAEAAKLAPRVLECLLVPVLDPQKAGVLASDEARKFLITSIAAEFVLIAPLTTPSDAAAKARGLETALANLAADSSLAVRFHQDSLNAALRALAPQLRPSDLFQQIDFLRGSLTNALDAKSLPELLVPTLDLLCSRAAPVINALVVKSLVADAEQLSAAARTNHEQLFSYAIATVSKHADPNILTSLAEVLNTRFRANDSAFRESFLVSILIGLTWKMDHKIADEIRRHAVNVLVASIESDWNTGESCPEERLLALRALLRHIGEEESAAIANRLLGLAERTPKLLECQAALLAEVSLFSVKAKEEKSAQLVSRITNSLARASENLSEQEEFELLNNMTAFSSIVVLRLSPTNAAQLFEQTMFAWQNVSDKNRQVGCMVYGRLVEMLAQRVHPDEAAKWVPLIFDRLEATLKNDPDESRCLLATFLSLASRTGDKQLANRAANLLVDVLENTKSNSFAPSISLSDLNNLKSLDTISLGSLIDRLHKIVVSQIWEPTGSLNARMTQYSFLEILAQRLAPDQRAKLLADVSSSALALLEVLRGDFESRDLLDVQIIFAKSVKWVSPGDVLPLAKRLLLVLETRAQVLSDRERDRSGDLITPLAILVVRLDDKDLAPIAERTSRILIEYLERAPNKVLFDPVQLSTALERLENLLQKDASLLLSRHADILLSQLESYDTKRPSNYSLVLLASALERVSKRLPLRRKEIVLDRALLKLENIVEDLQESGFFGTIQISSPLTGISLNFPETPFSPENAIRYSDPNMNLYTAVAQALGNLLSGMDGIRASLHANRISADLLRLFNGFDAESLRPVLVFWANAPAGIQANGIFAAAGSIVKTMRQTTRPYKPVEMVFNVALLSSLQEDSLHHASHLVGETVAKVMSDPSRVSFDSIAEFEPFLPAGIKSLFWDRLDDEFTKFSKKHPVERAKVVELQRKAAEVRAVTGR